MRPPLHLSSTHAPLIVDQHQRRLDHVRQRAPLLLVNTKSLSSSEKTRSHDAEFGEIAKTMRAASAHAGKRLPLTRATT